MKRLSSRDNPGLKAIAELAGSARERRRRAASYIEGVNLCDSNHPELIWNPWQREGFQERQQFIAKFKNKKGK